MLSRWQPGRSDHERNYSGLVCDVTQPGHQHTASYQYGAWRAAVGVSDPGAVGSCRVVLQFLRQKSAASAFTTCAGTLYELLRDHYLARVLIGSRQLLH